MFEVWRKKESSTHLVRLVLDTPEDRKVPNSGAPGLERRLQPGGCVANLLHQPPCPFHRQSGKIKRRIVVWSADAPLGILWFRWLIANETSNANAPPPPLVFSVREWALTRHGHYRLRYKTKRAWKYTRFREPDDLLPNSTSQPYEPRKRKTTTTRVIMYACICMYVRRSKRPRRVSREINRHESDSCFTDGARRRRRDLSDN